MIVLHTLFIQGLGVIKAIFMPDKAIKKHGQPIKITVILLIMKNFTGGICGCVCQDYLQSVKK
jgi:predicted nuclease of restriction endonuclease-like RecB superfamily